MYPTEILPLRLRQRGSSISTASNWILNYMIVQITPPAINNIGWKTYIIFAVLNTLWLPIIYFFFPETKGKFSDAYAEIIANNIDQDSNSKMSIVCSRKTMEWSTRCTIARLRLNMWRTRQKQGTWHEWEREILVQRCATRKTGSMRLFKGLRSYFQGIRCSQL